MRPRPHSRSLHAVAITLLPWALCACGGATDPGDGGAPMLLFVSFGESSNAGQLYLTDARGRAARAFGPREILDQPTLSPDGRRIAFLGGESGNPGVYVMNVDGSDRRRLSPGDAGGSSPAWSPDGTRIAFIYNGSAAAGARGVYVMNADGSGLRRVGVPVAITGPIAWSPDGTSLAVAAAPMGISEIHVVAVESGTARPLRTSDCGDITPAWSPDGRRIAFSSCVATPSGEERRIVAMNVDGTAPATLSDAPGAYRPAWSPDGRWVAFEAGAPVPGPSNQPPSYSMEVHVVAATGGTPRVVTQGHAGADGRPQWVPAGATLP